MDIKKVSVILSMVSIVSCTMITPQNEVSIPRQPQQTADETSQGEPSQSVEIQIKNSFQTMMNANTDGERSQQVAHFLNRQRDFFYIAQGLVNNFDDELSKLDQLKKDGTQLNVENKFHFAKASFQTRIAWEFSERNLQELLGVYELALTEANNQSSKYFRACTWIVTNISKWLDKGWKNGDQSAIISLAQDFDDINKDMTIRMQTARQKTFHIPSFKKYSEASGEMRAAALRQSLIYIRERKQTLFDNFIAKKWLEFSKLRMSNEESEIARWQDDIGRKPQALDILYPDPGGPGQVTGNRFPVNTWAMTFDDGPHPVHTQGMFNTLKDNGMSGTFFWLSQNISKYPQLVAQAGQLGFDRGSHSFSHANLPTLNQASLNHEINDALDVFKKYVGQPATLFRCPYGACGGSGSIIRQMIAKRKALHIFWNVDSLDWQDKNPQTVFERAKKQMEILNHGIVLFHDIHPQSVEAFKLLAAYVKQKGFSVKPLPQIIQEVTGIPYASP